MCCDCSACSVAHIERSLKKEITVHIALFVLFVHCITAGDGLGLCGPWVWEVHPLPQLFIHCEHLFIVSIYLLSAVCAFIVSSLFVVGICAL